MKIYVIYTYECFFSLKDICIRRAIYDYFSHLSYWPGLLLQLSYSLHGGSKNPPEKILLYNMGIPHMFFFLPSRFDSTTSYWG